MMRPEEAAASLLLSIAQQPPPRLNLAFPFNDLELPTAANLYQRRDHYRIHSILQSGLFPKVNWDKVKAEVMFKLGCLLHRKILAYFDFVSDSSTRQQVVDIDNLLFQEKGDVYVLHGNFIVYVVTFSSQVCSQIYSVMAKMTNISVELDEENIGEIKKILEGSRQSVTQTKCRSLRIPSTLPITVPLCGRSGPQ
jgi:hypothetical protein